MISELENRIRERAHTIWEREGRPSDRAHVHWSLASAELAAEPPRKPAPKQRAQKVAAAAAPRLEKTEAPKPARAKAAPKPASQGGTQGLSHADAGRAARVRSRSVPAPPASASRPMPA